MVPLSSLLPDIVLLVPGCPEPTVERALREGAREFCRRSYACVEYTDPVDVVAGERQVELVGLASTQKEVVGVLEVRVGDEITPQVSIDGMQASFQYAQLAPGKPAAAFQTGETSLELVPTPDSTYTLRFLVATAPTISATRIHPDLAGRWRSGVIAYAVATLAIQPDKSYSNPALGAAHMTMFRSFVADAKIERNRSYGRSLRVASRGSAFL